MKPVGAAAAVNALLGNLVGQLKSGKLKALAVDGTSRSPLLPNVPTLAESGFRGLALRAWFGILAPAGTPKPLVARLNAEIVRVAAVPAFVEKHLASLGLEPVLDSPEHFADFLREDIAKGEKLVRQAGLALE